MDDDSHSWCLQMLSGMEVGLELLPQAWGRASRGAVMDLARLQEVVHIRVISGCKWVLSEPLHTHTLLFALGPWGLLCHL